MNCMFTISLCLVANVCVCVCVTEVSPMPCTNTALVLPSLCQRGPIDPVSGRNTAAVQSHGAALVLLCGISSSRWLSPSAASTYHHFCSLSQLPFKQVFKKWNHSILYSASSVVCCTTPGFSNSLDSLRHEPN